MTQSNTPTTQSRLYGWGAQAMAYAVAIITAILVLSRLDDMHQLLALFIADVVATCVIFGFSVLFNNSSLYDPYWSVQPPMLALFWLLQTSENQPDALRALAVMVFVWAWAIRLTANFLYGWRGLKHEDWRYQDLRKKTGRAFWLVSFTGIQLLPTILVFLGCVPFMSALSSGVRPFNLIDAAAILVMIIGLYLETVGDVQLHRFAKVARSVPKTLDTGLWRCSRHPNYLGELMFWWGLAMFGVAAGGGWPMLIGAASITVLFVFISIPMIEKRHLERRADYAAYKDRVPMLLPFPASRKK